MRTTVDLPDELLRTAKMAAAERGASLKDLAIKAVSREVGAPGTPIQHRVRLPLIGTDDPTHTFELTNEDIEATFIAEDTGKYGR